MSALGPAVEAGLERFWERAAAVGRGPQDVTLVAVTKGFDVSVARAALDAGVVDLGESYVQELELKAPELAGPTWHFVGRLQRNKVRKAAPYVSVWHSVDRLSLAEEIARRSPGARVLVQVNVSEEPEKGGCSVADLPGFLSACTELDLEVIGLMTVGPRGPARQARPVFAELSRLADRFDLPERSMGMSNDLEVALTEGATMVRVGSALFGPRPERVRVED